MPKITRYASLALAVLLAGCGSSKQHVYYTYITTDSAPVQAVDQNAQTQLAESAVAVGQSLQELDAIEVATHPGVKMPRPLNAKSVGMSAITSVDWTGPVEPLLKKLALASHYKLRVLGSKPGIPAIVSISEHNKSLADILRNATFQVAKKANVTVYPSRRVIELRYNT